MLYLDSSLEIDGVTIFRDYNAANRFYYMPRAPHLTVDPGGQPLFQLLIYRRDITDNPDFKQGDRPGGGFLTMTVDLGVPQSRLDAIKGQLASLSSGGEVELAPVPFEKGDVRVSALGASAGKAPALEGGGEGDAGDAGAGGSTPQPPRFVENILGAAHPSLYGDNRTVFTIELSHEGAQLMRASLQDDGASQIAVIYDLEYRGLLPAYQAKITIDFKQSYSYLRTRLTANTLWFKADIDAEAEKLIKEGHITIDSTDYIENDPAKHAERATKLESLAKELATWAFFKPGLSPGKVLADDRGTLTAADATPTGPATASAPTPLQQNVVAPLLAAGSGQGSPGDVSGPRVQGSSLNAADTRVGGAATPAPTATAPTGAAAATPGAAGTPNAVDAWNAAGRPQAAYLMKSLSQEEQQTITYDMRQVGATKRSAGPQGSIRLPPGAARLPGRIKEVDLNDPFFERISGNVTSNADLAAAGVTSMEIQVHYGVRDDGTAPKDSASFQITKAGDGGPYSFFMDRAKHVEIAYDVAVNYKAGFAIGATASQALLQGVSTTTRNLDIDPRVVGAVFSVTLQLGAVDWNAIQSVQSTLVYDDAAGGVHGERTVVLTQSAPSAVIPIRPRDPEKRRFHVKTTFFYAAGVQEVVEQEGQGEGALVLNPPTSRAIAVGVTAVDPLGRYSKLSVELSYVAPDGAEQIRLIDLTGNGSSATWTFFRPNEAAEALYHHRVTLFGKDGTTTVQDRQESRERSLIIGDRFEGVLDVEARFLVQDFASQGFMGATLKLEYPDAPPGIKGTVEKFFTGPAPQPFNWRVPKRHGGGAEYRYTVTWIRADGTMKVVGPTAVDFEVLLILPPQGA